MILRFKFPLRKIIRGLERTRTFFFVLKSLVPTQSSQDKEKLSCPFQSTDNFPEWKLAFKWTSRENSLDLIELSSISKVSLV
jgi:hypothetical protein